MHPILSGPEAKRYLDPITETYLLFPYRSGGKLIPQHEMESKYPRSWKYLSEFKNKLIRRDNGELDDEEWYRFSRSQSLERVGSAKLYAAGTVPELRFSMDEAGNHFLTGGRVDGIVSHNISQSWFLLGVLNGVVANFVFRRIGRPKEGGWFEANKQFIAPLPVPHASTKAITEIGDAAKALQSSWTSRRDLLAACAARLGVLARHDRNEHWLWPDLPASDALENMAPGALRSRADRRGWAKTRLEEAIAVRLEALQVALNSTGQLEAAFRDGELRLLSGGAPILRNIFLDEGEGRLVEAYWRSLLLSQTWRDAETFAKALRRPPTGTDSPAATQFIERVNALAAETAAIEIAETAMNARLFELYELTLEERILVEKDHAQRRWA